MALFDRFKKQKGPPASAYKRLPPRSDDPKRWIALSGPQLKDLVMVKCIEYGVTQDDTKIPMLFALYMHAVERLDVSERLQLLTQFSAMTEERSGQGHMGLMMFMAVDNNAGVRSSAAMSLAVLFPSEDLDELAGPKFVVRALLRQDNGTVDQGKALGGVLLLGDKRLLPLLEETWSKLSENARLGLTQAMSDLALV